MTYFNLRKHAVEPEPEDVEEETPADEQEGEETEEEQPAGKTYGPLLTGLLGPGQWIAARFGMRTAWVVHVVAVWAIGFYGGLAAAGIILVWLLLVGLFVPREALDGVSDWIERRGKPAPATTSGGARKPGDREGALRLLYTVLGEDPAVHLRTVLAYLHEHGQWEDKTVADLRQHLEALGIPVQPKVKVGKTPTRGVLKADLEALSPIEETPPSPAPSPAV